MHFYPLICWWTLGCVHISVIVNKAAMTLQYTYQFELAFLEWITRKGIGESYSSSISNFLSNLQLFFTESAPIYIPINSIWVFHFLYILTNSYYL